MAIIGGTCSLAITSTTKTIDTTRNQKHNIGKNQTFADCESNRVMQAKRTLFFGGGKLRITSSKLPQTKPKQSCQLPQFKSISLDDTATPIMQLPHGQIGSSACRLAYRHLGASSSDHRPRAAAPCPLPTDN